jgi:hypothetical protein
MLSGTRSKVWRYSSTLLVLCLLGLPAVCSAAGAISQAYTTKSHDVSKGVLLSFVSDKSSEVEPANDTNANRLAGVAADKPLIELSGNEQNTIRVVTGGTTEALVSDANGDVKAGDKITISPISGLGMKAVSASEIVGTAQADLDAVGTVNREVSAKDGSRQTIKVGLVPVAINVTYYSAAPAQGTLASFVPPFLQSVANTIAGRSVSPIRVLFGATALLLGFIAVIVILQTSIRNGLISLGRNPLAQKALRKGLVDVIIATVGLLIIVTIATYVILVV